MCTATSALSSRTLCNYFNPLPSNVRNELCGRREFYSLLTLVLPLLLLLLLPFLLSSNVAPHTPSSASLAPLFLTHRSLCLCLLCLTWISYAFSLKFAHLQGSELSPAACWGKVAIVLRLRIHHEPMPNEWRVY